MNMILFDDLGGIISLFILRCIYCEFKKGESDQHAFSVAAAL